jgi:mono/diheme cytochrome c family protein
VAVVVAAATCSLSGIAAADHLMIEVDAPAEAIVGAELEISATVRLEETREPVEGTPVTFYADAFFAGVTGEIELGTADTNRIGVATFRTSFSVRGVHQVRAVAVGDAEAEPSDVLINIQMGPQIVASESGVEIPGLGSWVVTAVIAGVWVIMIVAAVWMVRASRSGREEEPGPTAADTTIGAGEEEDLDRFEEATPTAGRRHPGLASIVAGTMVVLGLGLVALLIRSPETHHNFDPEGYGRSPVAYLDAAYVYPGPGLADTGLTGNAIGDGRALFLKLGCAGCHGLEAQGAASARSPAFATEQWLETVVRAGLPGGMPAYSDADVSDEELELIHVFLLQARDTLAGETPAVPDLVTTTTATTEEDGASNGFAGVAQILERNCAACHGPAGGWSAADYDSVVNSGDNGPAVTPGDAGSSVLAQKLLGTQSFGGPMPPAAPLSDSEIQVVLDWIAGGALP